MLETMIKLCYALIFIAGASRIAVIAARMTMVAAASADDGGPEGMAGRP